MNRIVVVSNRVPVPTGGGVQAGGLAVALHDLMQRRGGVWFGWSGTVSDESPRQVGIVTGGAIQYATVDLTRDEHERYYNEFSNATLWPLLHSMPEHMVYDRRAAAVYRQVNERLSEALVPLLRPTDVIWVHDYHLMAMPAMLRARGVRAPIGFFLHIPFPAPDMLASVPEANALVRDLLASDLVGFQTPNDVENFASAAHRLGGATRVEGGLRVAGRLVRLGAFPVEIEAREFARMADEAWRTPATERLRRSLQGQRLVLGVDRMDPTKGLIQRLAGFRRLLETRPDWRRRATLLQIAAESRKDVSAYRDLRLAIDHEAGAINSEWGEADWTPIRLLAHGGSRDAMAGFMREARVGLVTPLRDGMNLVAKEYVAAQDAQDPGVLILSRFAGAAQQLTAALLVNPHDPDELADALDAALSMSLAERQDRWRALWGVLEGTSAVSWGRGFLAALLRNTSASAGRVAAVPGGGNQRVTLHTEALKRAEPLNAKQLPI